MKRYWWIDEQGDEHGPVTVKGLVALRSERTIDSTTLVRVEDGAQRPFHDLDLKDELERAGTKDMRRLVVVMAVALVGFASLFVAIFASMPLSTLALVVYATCVIVLAFIAGRHRQVGLSVTATLIPAAIGMMATIQQPALLEPLTPIACQEGETLVSRSARVVDTSRWRDTHASEETVFWTACETPSASRQSYAPMFVHGLALLLLFGVSNRVGRYAFATPP